MTEDTMKQFWEGLQAYFQEFEAKTALRPLASVIVPDLLRTVLEASLKAAGAPPLENWKIEVIWQLVPVTPLEDKS